LEETLHRELDELDIKLHPLHKILTGFKIGRFAGMTLENLAKL